MNVHPPLATRTKQNAPQQCRTIARGTFARGHDAVLLDHLLIAFVSLTSDVRGTMVGNPRVVLFRCDDVAPGSPASGFLPTRIRLAAAETVRSRIERMRQHRAHG